MCILVHTHTSTCNGIYLYVYMHIGAWYLLQLNEHAMSHLQMGNFIVTNASFCTWVEKGYQRCPGCLTSCRSLSAKEPLIVGLFCGKIIYKHCHLVHPNLLVSVTWLTGKCNWNSDMGWLRLIGPLKWQVSFAKEPYKRDCILKKRPIISRSPLIVAPPYVLHA